MITLPPHPALPPFISFVTHAEQLLWCRERRQGRLRATGCSWREPGQTVGAGCWPGEEGGCQAKCRLQPGAGPGAPVSGSGRGLEEEIIQRLRGGMEEGAGVTPREEDGGRSSRTEPLQAWAPRPFPSQTSPLSLGVLIWRMVTRGVATSWAAVGLW